LPRKRIAKCPAGSNEGVWGFTWDETSIDDDADEQRIRDVLDLIARGDEFDKLREQAYSEVEQPTPSARPESAAALLG
jgi:hypothetical protein